MIFAIDPVRLHRAADSIVQENLLTPSFFGDPANQAVIDQIRRTARNGHIPSRIALLRVGDSEMINLCLADLRSEHWSKTGRAADDIASSGRLKFIAMLAPDLNKDEDARPKVLRTGGENIRIRPVSVQAARAIQTLVRDSAQFSPEVRAWAAQLDKPAIDPYSEMKRESVRTWWRENQHLLEAEKYGEVQPPALK